MFKWCWCRDSNFRTVTGRANVINAKSNIWNKILDSSRGPQQFGLLQICRSTNWRPMDLEKMVVKFHWEKLIQIFLELLIVIFAYYMSISWSCIECLISAESHIKLNTNSNNIENIVQEELMTQACSHLPKDFECMVTKEGCPSLLHRTFRLKKY